MRFWMMLMLGLMGAQVQAAMQARPVSYELDGTRFESVLVYDDASNTPRPGLVMVPNWMGVSPAAVTQAKQIAGSRYVVLLADVYGVNVRPRNAQEAGAAAAALRAGERAELRARTAKAVSELKAMSGIPLQKAKLGAIGFCFGGGAVLELARAGEPLSGFVSFHGNLDTPRPEDARNIKAPLLVLHGADDPSVPPVQVAAFEQEMRAAGVDWQLVAFGGAVHSFTDPDANMPGRAQYHPLVSKRAFVMMHDFFDERFR